MRILIIPFLLGLAMAAPTAVATPRFEVTSNGMTVETDRCRVTVANGVVTELFNKLTGEAYLDGTVPLEGVVRHLPSGLGTQAGAAAYAAAGQLYQWPWAELPLDLDLPNQHFADKLSGFRVQVTGAKAELHYTNLTDGNTRFPDETFTLTLEIDKETGDLLLTPSAQSAQPGVYAANLTVAPTLPAIGIHAPIFDGVKLTSDMADCLWHTKWPDYWDYAFLALAGSRRGAVGIWAQDLELHYKNLFYRVKDGGIALALSTMNTPPFENLTEAKGVTWRIQAFDQSWAQAAKRFRDWRLANVKFAARPDWTRQISFVNSGVNAGKGWLDLLSGYLGGEHLERTATFAATIRGAAFDTKHWDNTPYPQFQADMAAWKTSGAKLMAYLQPMIMWGRPPEEDKEAVQVVALGKEADTIRPFTHNQQNLLIDQHNLATPGWQAWFLDWVRRYIQEHGADGVYHDQSYPCPADNRGLVNGLRSTQGMAEYFYKAATQNPNSIHGSEHLQEANTVGASLGIGSGILWGTAPHMRKQRLRHPSPVSNALHYPHATLWAFPHYSDFGTRGDAAFFHWGMDQMEGRGDIAGLALQSAFYGTAAKNGDQWRNELKLDRLRARLFVRHGLRPVYPEDWEESVLTYFRGAQGEDFRYVNTSWGSAFVQREGNVGRLHYGRAHGTRAAGVEAGIAGWVFYNPAGPSGLHPDRYYVIDPAVKRPAAYFAPAFSVVPGVPVEPSFYEGYCENGTGNDAFLQLRVEPIAAVGNIIRWDKVFLHSAVEPKAVFVNGAAVKPEAVTNGVWRIGFESPATITVLLQEPPVGLSDLATRARNRAVNSFNLDVLEPDWLSAQLTAKTTTNPVTRVTLTAPDLNFGGIRGRELHVPFRSPDKPGRLQIQFTNGRPDTLRQFTVNGVALDVLKDPAKAGPIEIATLPNDLKLISVYTTANLPVSFEWVENPPPASPAK